MEFHVFHALSIKFIMPDLYFLLLQVLYYFCKISFSSIQLAASFLSLESSAGRDLYALIFSRYTASCLALVTCMNEEHKLSFLKKIFTSEELTHFRLR